MSWFCLYFWILFSLDIEFWVDSFLGFFCFLSTCEKYCATAFWLLWSLMGNLLLSELLFPYSKCISSLSVLSKFFFFNFRSLIMMCLAVDCLYLHFFPPNLGNLAIISWSTFPGQFSLSCPSGTYIYCYSTICPCRLLFFMSIFSLLSDWKNYIVISSSSLILLYSQFCSWAKLFSFLLGYCIS